MCSFTGHLRRCLLGTATFGLVILVLGCSSRSTPPAGPDFISGIGDPSSRFFATFVQWKEGLKLLLVDDKPTSHSNGGGSSSKPYSWAKGSAASADGRGYKWQIETTDGKVATTFHIDGKEYDLSKGAVFVLTTKADKVEVHQMKRDLSAVPFDAEGCREFLNKDAEILKALGAGDLPK